MLGTSSFMEYVSSPLVSLTTMFLIVAGGLGFTVWHDVRMNLQDVAGQKRPLKRLFTRLHLQSKMVIVMTAGLIMIGTLGYFLLEYHNDATIGKLGFGEKLLASGFQSVTTRTAGFATVSQAELTSASKLFGCILMFIGGSPGGTAGGIKTTTMAILLLTCAAVIRGRKSTECFGRRLAESNVRSGIAIVFLTFAIWLTGLFGLAVLEPDERFIDLMYEATSAIGTVGLSADLTPSLTRGSHAILMILMYVGANRADHHGAGICRKRRYAGKIQGFAGKTDYVRIEGVERHEKTICSVRIGKFWAECCPDTGKSGMRCSGSR